MSTVAIVGIVATGLFILVTIAVAIQVMEKNNKEKRRIHSGLTGRARNFQYMLAGFPEGFLNRDLQILVCRSLQQIYSQLQQLEPSNQDHKNHAEIVNQKLQQLKKKPANNQIITITDTKQIQEIQKLLNNLFNFISKLTENKSISIKEGRVYAQQIRRLLIQTSLDALTLAKTQALQEGKDLLVVHYLQMGIDKMRKENNDGFFTNTIDHYLEQINELNSNALKKEDAKIEFKKKSADKWDEANKEDESWKKKALYD